MKPHNKILLLISIICISGYLCAQNNVLYLVEGYRLEKDSISIEYSVTNLSDSSIMAFIPPEIAVCYNLLEFLILDIDSIAHHIRLCNWITDMNPIVIEHTPHFVVLLRNEKIYQTLKFSISTISPRLRKRKILNICIEWKFDWASFYLKSEEKDCHFDSHFDCLK